MSIIYNISTFKALNIGSYFIIMDKTLTEMYDWRAL